MRRVKTSNSLCRSVDATKRAFCFGRTKFFNSFLLVVKGSDYPIRLLSRIMSTLRRIVDKKSSRIMSTLRRIVDRKSSRIMSTLRRIVDRKSSRIMSTLRRIVDRKSSRITLLTGKYYIFRKPVLCTI
ncbi:hypothetical protein BB561_000824 [Smittium simulii]|uniref:Uncharacterized protein n=1 Tax=Smittium simulii TaxID=133385 RepID=A0A2T9YXE8_9FUNG|nr:hypothetical protein BB561_000824 [Smittium simulii]